jgi:hypothetical protein
VRGGGLRVLEEQPHRQAEQQLVHSRVTRAAREPEARLLLAAQPRALALALALALAAGVGGRAHHEAQVQPRQLDPCELACGVIAPHQDLRCSLAAQEGRHDHLQRRVVRVRQP